MKVQLKDGRIGVLVPNVMAKHNVPRDAYAIRVGREELYLSHDDFEIEEPE